MWMIIPTWRTYPDDDYHLATIPLTSSRNDPVFGIGSHSADLITQVTFSCEWIERGEERLIVWLGQIYLTRLLFWTEQEVLIKIFFCCINNCFWFQYTN